MKRLVRSALVTLATTLLEHQLPHFQYLLDLERQAA